MGGGDEKKINVNFSWRQYCRKCDFANLINYALKFRSNKNANVNCILPMHVTSEGI